jgi:hypothetical protein
MESEIAGQMSIENKMRIAAGGSEMVYRIISVLEEREIAAQKYFLSSNQLSADDRKIYIDLVAYLNNRIKNILGL